MTDISSISGSQRLTSQSKVSLESAQQTTTVGATGESKEMEKLSLEMEQIQHAFALIKEIRMTLESALQDLSPN